MTDEDITDEDIRAVVRDAIARHVSAAGPSQPPHGGAAGITAIATPSEARHSSHGLLMLDRGSDADGACLIEPAVRCTHCGYCQSFGH
jgi:hypothetical protein